MNDRAAILQTLADNRAALVARYRAMDPETLTTPCTDSEADDGSKWTPKDHLAHLLRIEEAFLGMCERARSGEERPVQFRGTTREEALAGVHDDNERHVESLRQADLDTLLAELDAARSKTLAFLETLTDEELDQKIPGAPWGDGTIGGVLATNAGHEQMHVHWVDEGLTR